MKIVINKRHGGFSLSHEAVMEYAARKGIVLTKGTAFWYDEYYKDDEPFHVYEINRDDPDLVTVVEKLGERADTKFSKLKVVEIPDDVDWVIEEYDGVEWVAEVHRIWS